MTPPQESRITLRPAAPADAPLIVRFIEELADYERLRDVCRANAEDLARHLFGPRPYAEVVLAFLGDEPAGFALFFHTYSTFESAPSLYLEDLFVRPPFRGRGVGRLLLQRLAGIAVERRCKRMEWAVLDWNQSAIDFYLKLGARVMNEWTVYRLDGEALNAVARA